MDRLKIVYFGDSIMVGQYLPPECSWVSLVTERLQLDNQDLDVSYRNNSVSGDTSLMGLLRFPADVQEHYPDILIIQFGLNDCNCWKTDLGVSRVSEILFPIILKEMLLRARNLAIPRIVLMTSHPTLKGKMCNNKEYELCNLRYASIVRALALEEQVVLCDIRNEFKVRLTKYGCLASYLLEDGIHLSEKGHQLYSEILYPTLSWVIQDLKEGDRGKIIN